MKKIAVTCVLAICLAALPAAASTFVALSGQQMLDQSHAIVQGKVIDLQSSWTESGRLIVTDVKIKVSDRLLGHTDRVIKVRTFGGEVGSMKVEAHGFPVFEKGSEVILFLGGMENGRYSVLGYQQGHFRVVEGVRFIEKSGRMAAAQRSVEIGAFKAAIRGAAAKRGTDLAQ